MVSVFMQSKVNEECPMLAGKPHDYTKDTEDKRFKYCIYCGKVEYRTDAELMGEE